MEEDSGSADAAADADTDAAPADAGLPPRPDGSMPLPVIPPSKQEPLPDAAVVEASGLSWKAGTDCPVSRFEAVPAVLKDELWVMGGYTTGALDATRRIDIYNPETDKWRLGPTLPGAETHFGVAIDDGDLLIFAGINKQQMNWPTDKVWRLKAGATTWVEETPLPQPRAAVQAAVLDGKLHVAGGLAGDNSTDLSEHLVRELKGTGAWSNLAELPDPRNHGGGAAAGGLFYVVGGRHMWNELDGQSASVHAYDPKTMMWTERASLPTARSEIGASTVVTAGGRIITVGGSTPGNKPSANVLEYTPGSNSWRPLAPLPQPVKGAVAVRIGDKLIVTTGSSSLTEPSAATWIGCCVK